MAKQIAVFNHKGGVAKTTTVFHLGWMLAEKGQRVLLVDCDPQCNLSWVSLGYQDAESGEYPFNSIDGHPCNIQEGLEPVFEARPVPLKPVSCREVPKRPGLFLLPGHVELARYENTLGIAQQLSGAVHALQNIPGSLRHLFSMTAEKYAIDLVLIDMSPSLGPLNQNILMSSEYFIIPMAPDYFADLAIKSLSRTLPEWKTWAVNASDNTVLAKAHYPWKRIDPKFIGSIIQNYVVRSGAPTRAFRVWFDKLEKAMRAIMIPSFREADLLLNDDKYKTCQIDPNSFFLRVKNFSGLAALSHDYHKPVFALNDEDLFGAGAVAQPQKANRDEFYKKYAEAADKIICAASE